MITATVVIDELVEQGLVLPEYRDTAVNQLDRELRRQTARMARSLGKHAASALSLLEKADNCTIHRN